MGFVMIMSTSCEMPKAEVTKYWQKLSSKVTITKYYDKNMTIQDKNE